MADDNIGKVEFGVEAKFDDEGIKQAKSSVDELGKTAKTSGKSIGGLSDLYDKMAQKAHEMSGGIIGTSESLVTLGATAAVTGSILGVLVAKSVLTSLGTVAIQAAETADQLDRLSQRTGISAGTLQEYALVLNRNDFSQQQFATGLQQLGKHMEDLFTPTSEISKAFKTLGLTIGPGTPPDQAFEEIAKKIAALPNGLQKSAVAMQIFGRAGGEMLPVLNEIGQGMAQVKNRANELGTVLSESQIAALKDLDAAWDDLTTTMRGFVTNVGSLVAPLFTPLANAITDLIGRVSKLTQEWAKSPLNAKELNALPQAYVDKKQSEIKQAREQRGLAAMQAMSEDITIGLRGLVKDNETGIGNIGASIGDKMLHGLLQKLRQPDFERALSAMNREMGLGVQSQTERNTAFGNQMMQQESVNNLQFAKPSASQSSFLEKQVKDAQALMALFPHLTFMEANILAIHNSSAANKVIDDSQKRLQILGETEVKLGVVADTEEAFATQAAAAYTQLGTVFGDAQLTRVAALDAIDARQSASIATLARQLASGEIIWETYYQKVLQLDLLADSKRREVVSKFPTFMEQQLTAVAQSNTFSVASMVSSWSGGIAQIAVHGGNLVAIWQQTQVALIQSAIQMGTQLLAQMGLWAAQEIGLTTAKEQTKSALALQGATERQAIASGEAVAEVGIMQGAQTTILGLFGAVSGALKVMFLEVLVPAITAVGTFIMGVLTAIATAMADTIFGIPVALVILAGVAAIGVAIAAGVGAFANGGIVTGPTLGLVGEAGSSEAIIPLNSQGAGFMADMLGLSGQQQQSQSITLELDGQTFRRWLLRGLPDDVRLRAGAIA